MPSKKRALSGFAIVEVLVATVVLAIGFLELARAFRNINGVAVQAVAMTKASNLAHATMERIMALNFDARGNDLEFGDYALDFDGEEEDYVHVGDIHSDIKTISFWIQASAVSGTDYVIDLNGTAYITIATGVVTASNGITSPTYYLNAVEVSSTSDRTITAGAWYHVAITTASSINANDVDVGRILDDPPGPGYFDGKIDEIRLWDDEKILTNLRAHYNRSLPSPYDSTNLKLYLRMNNDPGTVAFDHSSNMAHGTINGATYTSGSISWTSNSNLGNDGEAVDWSTNNDVDDFYKTGPDSPLLDDGFSGLGRRIYVKYVSVSGSSPSYSFSDSGTPTNYKQITVKVGIPGTTDSTQLDAIKAAKVNQGYSLTFSPYGN